MSKIYLTHSSWKKDEALRGTGKLVAPEQLYTAQYLQRFVRRCKEAEVEWAIFSSLHGILFPADRVAWYEKDFYEISEADYQGLLEDFVAKLEPYDEIWFYHNPGRFYLLYQMLVMDVSSRGYRLVPFSHLDEIG